MKERGLFDEEERLNILSKLGDNLETLNKKINWELFRPILKKALKKTRIRARIEHGERFYDEYGERHLCKNDRISWRNILNNIIMMNLTYDLCRYCVLTK